MRRSWFVALLLCSCCGTVQTASAQQATTGFEAETGDTLTVEDGDSMPADTVFLFLPLELESPTIRGVAYLLNEFASDQVLPYLTNGPAELKKRGDLKAMIGKQLGHPVMLFALAVRNHHLSADDLEFPGPVVFVIKRPEGDMHSLGVTKQLKVSAGELDIAFVIFKEVPLTTADALDVLSTDE